MPENGETLDLKRVRLTVGQFVWLFVMVSALVASQAVVAFTTTTSAEAMQKIAEVVQVHSVRLAVHDAQIQGLRDQQRSPAPARRTTRRDTTPED